MAKYYFTGEDGTRTYIKTIDFAEGKLEFTKNEDEAYKGRDGYYANPLKDQLSTLFSNDYPQVKNIHMCGYSDYI